MKLVNFQQPQIEKYKFNSIVHSQIIFKTSEGQFKNTDSTQNIRYLLLIFPSIVRGEAKEKCPYAVKYRTSERNSKLATFSSKSKYILTY